MHLERTTPTASIQIGQTCRVSRAISGISGMADYLALTAGTTGVPADPQKGIFAYRDVRAETAGLTKAYISGMERGLKVPSLTTILRLALALDMQGRGTREHVRQDRPAVAAAEVSVSACRDKR